MAHEMAKLTTKQDSVLVAFRFTGQTRKKTVLACTSTVAHIVKVRID